METTANDVGLETYGVLKNQGVTIQKMSHVTKNAILEVIKCIARQPIHVSKFGNLVKTWV